MAVITFLSDFGTKDHYVAAVKASILSINPGIQIIDLSHSISPYDISQAAYVLSHSFRLFPKGTVHLIAMNDSNEEQSRLVAVKLEDHYFVGSDSGIFSLLSDETPTATVLIPSQPSVFLAKDEFAPIAAKLASGADIHSMGKRLDGVSKLFRRQPKLTKKEIVGNIVHIDRYGNLISNINRIDFDKILELNQKKIFEIQIGREKYTKIQQHYSDADPGECCIVFNSSDQLEIGINLGNAAELLGLRFDSPIFIYFE